MWIVDVSVCMSCAEALGLIFYLQDGHALRQFRYSCNTVPIRTKATGLGRMHLTLRWLLVRAARRWNGSCGSTLVPVDEKEKRTDVAIAWVCTDLFVAPFSCSQHAPQRAIICMGGTFAADIPAACFSTFENPRDHLSLQDTIQPVSEVWSREHAPS